MRKWKNPPNPFFVCVPISQLVLFFVLFCFIFLLALFFINRNLQMAASARNRQSELLQAVGETLDFFSLVPSGGKSEFPKVRLPFADGSQWEPFGSKRGITMETRAWSPEISAFAAYKSQSNIDLLCSAETLAQRLYDTDFDFWKNADEDCLEYRTVEELSTSPPITRAKINYIQQKLPFPIWNRDICSIILLARLPQVTDQAFNGSWLVLWRGTEHPSTPDMSHLKIQRGVVTIGGYLIQPVGKTQTSCRLHRFFHADPGGWVPSWLVQQFVSSELVEMLEAVQELQKS